MICDNFVILFSSFSYTYLHPPTTLTYTFTYHSENLQREMFKIYNLNRQARKREKSYILRLAEL